MPRIFGRVHSVGEFKTQEGEQALRKGGNQTSGRGQPRKRAGTNRGDVWEDCSPHSTQPGRSWGRGFRARITCSVQ